MHEFVLDKTLVLIGPAAGLVLAVTLSLVNFSCYSSLAKIWCEKHGGNCLLLRSYLDTLQPSTKVCPGKIWSVYTYHNYVNPNMPMDSMSMYSSTLQCLRWMQGAVWRGCQYHSWCNKWPRTPNFEPSRVDNCLRLLPYANGQHINVLKHFVNV